MRYSSPGTPGLTFNVQRHLSVNVWISILSLFSIVFSLGGYIFALTRYLRSRLTQELQVELIQIYDAQIGYFIVFGNRNDVPTIRFPGRRVERALLPVDPGSSPGVALRGSLHRRSLFEIQGRSDYR